MMGAKGTTTIILPGAEAQGHTISNMASMRYIHESI